jgi:hypothetical protein
MVSFRLRKIRHQFPPFHGSGGAFVFTPENLGGPLLARELTEPHLFCGDQLSAMSFHFPILRLCNWRQQIYPQM